MPRFGDLLAEALRGGLTAPSNSAIEGLRLLGNDIDAAASIVRKWAPGGGSPSFPEVYIDKAIWGASAMPLATFTKSLDQSIPDNTVTALNFATNWELQTPVSGRTDFSSSTTGITRPRFGQHDLYMIFGQISFGTSAVGIRSASVQENGTSALAQDLFALNPISGDWTIIPFANIAQVTRLDSTEIQIKVYQDSGGPLNIEGGNITIVFLGRDLT